MNTPSVGERKTGVANNLESNLGFRSEHRLRTATDFSRVFSVRRVLRGVVFDLHYHSRNPAVSAEPSGARLGIVIAKKLANRAVQRNLLKRLARESFRLARSGLPPCDLVLRLAKPAGTSLDLTARQTWRADIDHLLNRLPR